ncbi:MAG: NTP transferase domain-containing protein [Defluviitaleaceae bacterium]|nr:NTP transferase domain-containing protein [Defluviitaleaceae bacterium]
MDGFVTVVLAAGQGTRMNSSLPKVVHKIFDKAMVSYAVDAAFGAGSKKAIIVTGFKEEIVRSELLGKENIIFSHQDRQLGTGHAASMALPFITAEDDVLILYGDMPLLTKETLKNIHDIHKAANADLTLQSTNVDNPFGYGRIVRKDGLLEKIVEQKDATHKQQEINEINTGLYCFKASALREAILGMNNNNAQNELYLTDAVEILLSKGKKVQATISPNNEEFVGVNSRVELAHATKIMQKRINEKLMISGVTIIDPTTTYISVHTKIGKDTIIMPGTVIEGDCVIGQNCTLGPYAHLRPGTILGDNVRIGNFVETKNATLGTGTKVAHLSYIGDALLGENVNFSCGAITVNYDGKNKHLTKIEDNAFIGCNTNLIAPVEVGKGAFIAAGSTITDNLPPDSFGIARQRQTTKENYIKKT